MQNRTTFMERMNERITATEATLRKLDPVEALLERISLLEDSVYSTKDVFTFSDACKYLYVDTEQNRVHCQKVLHLNKANENVRGHIGTELSNKAETVLVISRSQSVAGVSEVQPLNIRDREFAPFAFSVDDEGLPVAADNYSPEGEKENPGRVRMADITDQQHEEALSEAFGNAVISGYENTITALKRGYATVKFNRGRTVMSRLLTLLLKRGLVVKCGGNDYCLPDKRPVTRTFDFDNE